jgi:hypothetical protein
MAHHGGVKRCRSNGGWIHGVFVALFIAGSIMAAAGCDETTASRPENPDLSPFGTTASPERVG